MLKLLLLLCLLGALGGYLHWRRTPRSVFFGAMFISVWVYAIAFWVTVGTLDQINSNLENGFLPYFPPIIPVIVFVAWFLAGSKPAKK
jgi:hypothetical protein